MKRWKNRPEGSNWGDFGEDDQRGRMNLLTPEVRREAVREVQEGLAFCLSLPLDYPGGSKLFATRRPPRLFAIERKDGDLNYHYQYRKLTGDCNHTDVVCDDAVTLFTQYSTQWDGFAHYGSLFDADGDGVPEVVYYNGFRAGEHIVAPSSPEASPEARALGVQNLAEACPQGRGVMVNLHAVYGTQRAAVGYDELMTILDQQRVDVRRGDFLCLYTGFGDALLAMNRQPDPEQLHSICAGLDGLDPALLKWIDDSGIVAICADNPAVEVRVKGGKPGRPKVTGPRAYLGLHAHCLFKLGIHLGELWYFSELARWLAEHGRSSFLLTAPPLRLPGSAGSPLTPIATV